MAIFKPFRAIRPTNDKVHLVASRSFHNYSKKELEVKLSSNPFTFIHVINPEFGLPDHTEYNSEELFHKVKAKFEEFLDEGIFEQDNQEAFYIYNQTTPYNDFTGIIGLTGTNDYRDDRIKKHELTLEEREYLFRDYLQICDFHAEPVLLTYPKNDEIEILVENLKSSEALYDFSTSNRVRHKLWRINDPIILEKITSEFSKIDNLYIADGHHRSASSYLISETGMIPENHPYKFFMSFLIPNYQLQILEYNRMIKDLNGLTSVEFLKKLENGFKVCELGDEVPLDLEHAILLYLDKTWFVLKFKHETEKTDAEILNEWVLTPILAISDFRNDERLGYTGGRNGTKNLVEKVDSGQYRVGFCVNPINGRKLMKMVNEGKTLPPKSTWIEPKLRSGLTIYSYSH